MKKYKLTFYCLTITALLFWSVGCDEDDPVETPPLTGLEILEVPQTLLANIDSVYTVRVRIADEGVNPDYIRCDVSGPNEYNPESFFLYDDGSLNELAEHPYADSLSGDIVPNNGTYTRTVNGRLLAHETAGDYLFSFSVPGQSNPVYSKTATILTANIEPCIIEEAPQLNGMVECFEQMDVSVTLSRTEPDEIDTVRGVVIDNGDDEYEFLLNPTEVDTVWTATVSPATFPCLASGVHHLEYRASTKFGLNCTLEMGTVAFTNDAQTISDLVGLPDTLYRPTAVGDTDTVVVTLGLDDCNLAGIQTFNGVRFEVKRDDGDYIGNSTFVLNDAGVSGDTVAGDGTYSVGLTFNLSETYLDNQYIFRYFSQDCLGIDPPFSNYLYDTVRVIQPPADLDDIIPSSDEIGFQTISSPFGRTY